MAWELDEGQVEIFAEGEEIRDHSKPSEYVRMLPHYGKVPKDIRELLNYREMIRVDAEKRSEKALRNQLLDMSAEDPLFWANVFCSVMEPRADRKLRIRPFNSWPAQDNLIGVTHYYMGRRDIVANKSRGEGCSWAEILELIHQWRFVDFSYFGLVSMNKNLADSSDLNSLMGKIAWEILQLPKWMLPRGFNMREHRKKSDRTLLNPENNSLFSAFACTENVATATRQTAFLMDELGKWQRPDDSTAMTSTQFVTDCRIIISTPFGNEGAYYNTVNKKSSAFKVVMHWSQNPTRNRGLYQYDLQAKKLVIFDEAYYAGKPKYPFNKDGKLRSPWYDKECNKPETSERSIAQDLDLNFEQSVSLFFDTPSVEAAERTVRAPMHVGDFIADDYGGAAMWSPSDTGICKLWMPLVDGIPAQHRNYIVGVDIAGSGSARSSNSVIQVLDRDTGEQLLEWARGGIHPSDFATVAVGVCRWLGNGEDSPVLIWEAQGPGGDFGAEVANLHYNNVYEGKRRGDLRHKIDGRRVDRKPGITLNAPGLKLKFLDQIRVALKMATLTVRSAALIEEMPEFRWSGNDVVHYRATAKDTDEGSRQNFHGDRVSAMGCAVWARNEYKNPRKKRDKTKDQMRNPPINSIAGRMKARERERADKRFIF